MGGKKRRLGELQNCQSHVGTSQGHGADPPANYAKIKEVIDESQPGFTEDKLCLTNGIPALVECGKSN